MEKFWFIVVRLTCPACLDWRCFSCKIKYGAAVQSWNALTAGQPQCKHACLSVVRAQGYSLFSTTPAHKSADSPSCNEGLSTRYSRKERTPSSICQPQGLLRIQVINDYPVAYHD